VFFQPTEALRRTRAFNTIFLELKLRAVVSLGGRMATALQINFALWGMMICAEIRLSQLLF
jgi:hypothetical protein